MAQYRPLATSSLQRNSSLHHAYTDSALSSKTTSSYDEGYNSRHTTSDSIFPGDDIRHERTGSKDSSDYIYIGAGQYIFISDRIYIGAGPFNFRAWMIFISISFSLDLFLYTIHSLWRFLYQALIHAILYWVISLKG